MAQQHNFTSHNATEIEEKQGKTYLLYANPGMGKTHTLRHLPGKTLVLDIDRTSQVLKGEANIDIIYVDNQNTWEYWEALLTHLKEVKGKYENIAVDNVSELERCLLSHLGFLGKNQGVPSQGDYQKMQFRVVNSFRWMKNLADRIVFTAWETTDLYTTAEGQQYNRSYPQINQKILNNVLGLCDVVGRLMINPEGDRGFVLQGTNSIYAKNQLDSRKGCKQEDVFLSSTNENTGGNK
ncbi:AAA family ATPase [Bacillus lacus]|uniref:AAA family ATPase n=1 Tax=Metabacillus lacus TaxID=1983721 RepID=A0A7X2IW81_9BACI|nr:AAA family ATPase [Metabacillus lacus]MRX70875.1 AAA family ATPase [Metabacillus lacus]